MRQKYRVYKYDGILFMPRMPQYRHSIDTRLDDNFAAEGAQLMHSESGGEKERLRANDIKCVCLPSQYTQRESLDFFVLRSFFHSIVRSFIRSFIHGRLQCYTEER